MGYVSPGKSDMELLFGVLGGGSVSGQSGTLIKEQLNQLVGELNNAKNTNERKIRFTVDTANSKVEFRKKLTTIVNDIGSTNNFKVKITKIDASSAITQLRDDINDALKMLKVDTGFDVSVNADGSKSAIKQVAADAEEAIKKTALLKAQLEEVERTKKSLDKSYDTAKGILGGENATGENLDKLEVMRNKYLEMVAAFMTLEEKQGLGRVVNESEIENVRTLSAEVKTLTDGIVGARDASTKYSDTLTKANKLLAEIKKGEENWTKAKNGISSKDYSSLFAYQSRVENLIKNYKDDSPEVFAKKVKDLSKEFQVSASVIKANGENARTLADRFKNLSEKFSTWLTVSQVIMFLVRQVKKMITTVIELDDAMTELKKVTDETDAAYEKFFKNASKRAKELGATLKDTINATASFARLGYDITDASALADAAVIYNNVGDEIESIDDASQSIISTMQAFGVEAQNVMTIVDKFNEVGKSLPKSIVICWAKALLVAISVKGQRWLRPSKDFVVLIT